MSAREVPHWSSFRGDIACSSTGGGYYDRSIFDVGERLVAPFLRRRKILTLDAVVLSHPDSDHLNGLLAIAEQFHVKTLWTTGVETDGGEFQDPDGDR